MGGIINNWLGVFGDDSLLAALLLLGFVFVGAFILPKKLMSGTYGLLWAFILGGTLFSIFWDFFF